MADNNNILNEAETASENDNLDNNLTNEDYNGTTDNKESQYVPLQYSGSNDESLKFESGPIRL